MKKLFFCFMLAIIAAASHAQDTLFFKNGTVTPANIQEIGDSDIRYKKPGNDDGPDYLTNKTEVDHIIFKNGKRRYMDETPVQPAMMPQDTLFFKNGNIVPAKIQEIGMETIRYKKTDNDEGPDYITNKTEVNYVVFKNGTRENVIIEQERQDAADRPEVSVPPSDNRSMYNKGINDAMLYYNHPCGALGTGLCTFALGGILGLIPAIACSSTPPKEKNLGYPNARLWQNGDYKRGYADQAYKMKRRRVWTGFGVGAGLLLALVLVLSVH